MIKNSQVTKSARVKLAGVSDVGHDPRVISMEDAARLIQRQTDIIMQLRTQVSLLEAAVKDWECGVPMTMTGDRYVCPFDCDNCHDDDCPCDRLGCAGYRHE